MIRYRLDDLGWFQFEWLCQSLLKTTLGLSVEAWGGCSDLGRDAYCKESLFLHNKTERTNGPFVFQAKFVEGANASGAKAWGNLQQAVSREMAQLRKRLKRDKTNSPAYFILLTNAPVSAKQRVELETLVRRSLATATPMIWGANDLCGMLDNAPNIRVAFPQLLGLRDLQELLHTVVDKDILQRSTLSISKAEDLAPVFVPTSSYDRALATLNAHNFVVLTGPPEVGKTTIARMIALSKLGEGWESYECRDPADVIRIPRSKHPQIFLADDAFGTTDFRPDVAQAWASDLDGILRLLDERHWLIWTSRPAPLHLALKKMHLQGRAEHFPEPGEVLVDAAELSRAERALILYRHAKHAGLEQEAKEIVKKNASLIIENDHFTPERAKRFIGTTLPELIQRQASEGSIRQAIKQEIEEPTISMKKSFNALSLEHRKVLIAMLDAGSGQVTRERLTYAIERHIGSKPNIANLIEDLSAHFLSCG